MSVDDIRTAIKQAIVKVSKLDPLTVGDCSSFRDDLGLDSLSILEVIVEIECRFQIPDLSDDDYSTIQTVDDAVRFVQSCVPLARC
jgi:acyl carrier protein